MAVRDSYRDFVLDQLNALRPVTGRRMFGGIGLYAEGIFFGVMDNDTLFFRTGDSNRAAFEARGMPPFQPLGPGTQPMAYHEVPGDVLENRSELATWLNAAITEAAHAGSAKRPRTRSSPKAPVKAPAPASRARTPRRPRPPAR